MPGELISRDGQAELRGLLIGSGTRYPVEDWAGLGLPEIRHDDHDLEADDGSAGGFESYARRSISARVGISADTRTELGELRTALRRAFARVSGPTETVPFAVRLAGAVRIFDVRPRRLELPWGSDESSKTIMTSGAFEVVALDPFAYAATESTAVLTIPNGATASPSTLVTMPGDGRSRPIVTIQGPATDPMVSHVQSGKALRLAATLSGSDVLEVDVAAMRMTLNGSPVWAGAPDNEWLELVGGDQNLIYSRTGGGAPSTATVAWRHAWAGV